MASESGVYSTTRVHRGVVSSIRKSLKFQDQGADLSPESPDIAGRKQERLGVRNSSSTLGNRPDSNSALPPRRFGTTDLAIVLGLWSAMAVLVGGVLSELASDTDTPMAKAQSEAYAQQLALAGGSEEGDQPGRGPASLPTDKELRSGTLGKDPWGKPYYYRIVNSAVVVWSGGRNQEADSGPAIDRLESGQPLQDFRFMGDDVGFVQVRHNSISYRQ